MTLLSALNASLDHLTAFAPGQDFCGQNPIFEKTRWEAFTKGMRIFLTIATALLLMYELRAARLRERNRDNELDPNDDRARQRWLRRACLRSAPNDAIEAHRLIPSGLEPLVVDEEAILGDHL